MYQFGTEVTYVLTYRRLGVEKPLGTFTIGNDKTASVTFAPIADYLLEGEETFTMELYMEK